MAAPQARASALLDRFSASDPGLLRLTAGLRTVASIVLTLAGLAAFGAPVRLLVVGATAAMVATTAVTDARPYRQAVTLAVGLPVSLAAVTLGALLNPYRVAGDAFFLLMIFAVVYVRRFSDRGTAWGTMVFQYYFVSLFVHADLASLPPLYGTVAAAFCCAAVGRFLLVPATPERTLDRLRRAFRARLAQVVATGMVLVGDAAEGPGLEKAVAALRHETARLHATALMIQSRLDDGTRDAAEAALLQRRIAGAEIAAERLGLLLVKARDQDNATTLTLHLPPLPGVSDDLARPVSGARRDDAVSARLARDLAGLRMLITRFGPQSRSTALNVLRNRLLGYRDEKNLPPGPLVEQDVFRGIGEAARAVLGLRLPSDGPQDESDDAPETIRSREELDAEALTGGGTAADGAAETQRGLRRGTTRAAFQVTVGSALAVVGGELLSAQRWYWAVLTCWVVFLNTSSTGEILVKGYRRLLGTVLGVAAGAALAGAVGHHVWTALALVLLCVFGMFFTAPLSYALMSFFVTAMLGLLYTLLNTYSLDVLVLRIEETALGAACGVIAALLVLPVRTDDRTDQQLVTVLQRLREVSGAAVGQLSGGPATDLLAMARDLDTALNDFRASTRPLTHPITPLRGRRRTARYLVGLLETCAYQTRNLAATAELIPDSGRIAADPRLAPAGRRIDANLGVLVHHLTDERATGRVEAGASVAAILEGPQPDAPHPGSVTFRVLRHIQRLDECVVGLARPLGVPVDTGRTPGTAPGAAPVPSARTA